MKEYQTPEMEIVEFSTTETVMNGDGVLDGDVTTSNGDLFG